MVIKMQQDKNSSKSQFFTNLDDANAYIGQIQKEIENSKNKNQELAKKMGNIKNSQRLIQYAYDNLPIIIWSLDKDGIFNLSEGKKTLAKIGLQPQEVVGLSVNEVYKTFPTILEAVNETFEGKSINKQIKIGDFIGNTYFHPIKDDNGQIIGSMGVSIDITEKIRDQAKIVESEIKYKALFEELQDSEIKYRLLIDNLHAGVVVHAPDTSIIIYNQRALELLGLNKDQIIGKKAINPDWDFLNEDSTIMELKDYPVNRVCRTMKPIKNQMMAVKRSDPYNDIVWVNVNGFPYFSDKGVFEHVVISFIDFTARREAEIKVKISEELKKIEHEKLQNQKLESLGMLAGGLAHDFNNLLVGILGNANLLHLNDNKLDEESLEMINDIIYAAKSATKLTNQLLTFSKGGSPIKKAVDIKEIIQFCIKMVLSRSKSKCQIFSHGDIPPVNVDVSQIQQVINNILLNADQSMPEGGTIKIKLNPLHIEKWDLEFRLTSGYYVKVSITDEGIGIPDEIKEKIFTPYFSTKPKGIGLGLATAYSIIKRHMGRISFESKQYKGTTFNIYLPISSDEVLIIENEENIHLSKVGKILVLDDDPIVLKLIQNMLHKLNQKVVTVTDGSQVLEKYQKAIQKQVPFDLVIMDLTIPGGMGGKETVNKLYKIDPNVKAIVSSGYSTDPIMANFRDFKFKGVLKKPYTINQVKRIISNLL